MSRHPPRSTLLPSPPLFRSRLHAERRERQPEEALVLVAEPAEAVERPRDEDPAEDRSAGEEERAADGEAVLETEPPPRRLQADRKSTRLNSSHANISYAVFC